MPLLARDRPSARPDTSPGRWRSDAFVIAAASTLALLISAGLSRPPATVGTVTIANPHPYELSIAVRTQGEPAWSPLPIAGSDTETVVHDVIDQGDPWEISVRAQGVDGGRFTVDRRQLEADGWRLEIPDEVATRLREAGAAPSPD